VTPAAVFFRPFAKFEFSNQSVRYFDSAPQDTFWHRILFLLNWFHGLLPCSNHGEKYVEARVTSLSHADYKWLPMEIQPPILLLAGSPHSQQVRR
jgi:hypothetical protein